MDDIQYEGKTKEQLISELKLLRQHSDNVSNESSAQLIKAQEIAHIGSFAYTISNKLTSWSAESCRILGLKPQQPKQSLNTILQQVHPDDHFRVEDTINAGITGAAWDIQYQINHPSNGIRIIHSIAQPEVDNNNQLIGITGIVQDITATKKLQNSLEERESLLKQCNEVANIGYAVWDEIQDKYISVSDGYAAISGYTVEEYLARFTDWEQDMQQIHPEDKIRYSKHYDDENLSAQTQDIEYRIKRRDGKVRHMVECFRFVVDENGKRVQSLVTLQDITEHKLIEERLELALVTTKSTVWDWNVLTGEVYYDKNLPRLSGYTNEEIKDTSSWESHVHPDDLPAYRHKLKMHLENETDFFNYEYRLQHKDGHYFWFGDNGKVIERDGEGKPLRMIGIETDITEKKEQENKLIQSQKLDALGKLTGGIAHDFNNLLGIILGYAQLLEKKTIKLPELSNNIMQIQYAGKRGAKIINKLLSISTEQGYEAKKSDLNYLLQQQKDMLQKVLTVKIKLNFTFADSLWPVLLDENQFADAILNISINAMHSMSDMHSKASLSFSLDNQSVRDTEALNLDIAAGGYVVLSITDTGCGMDESTRSQIFDTFFTTKGDKGTGLGLSQVFNFVNRAGGTIRVISEPEIGSTFFLYFPHYLNNRNNRNNRNNNVEPDVIDVVTTGDENILIVDDEEALLLFLTEILTAEGYNVISANGGIEALEILALEPIDLLITDILMPDMNGYELVETVQRQYPDIKTRLASGFNNVQQPDGFNDDLVQNIIPKPYDIYGLLKNIRYSLDS